MYTLGKVCSASIIYKPAHSNIRKRLASLEIQNTPIWLSYDVLFEYVFTIFVVIFFSFGNSNRNIPKKNTNNFYEIYTQFKNLHLADYDCLHWFLYLFEKQVEHKLFSLCKIRFLLINLHLWHYISKSYYRS